MDVNLEDGNWSVVDTSTALFRDTTLLGGIIDGDSINTLASTPLADASSTPNSWWIRYTHTATGCPTSKDTFLRINPLPSLSLDLLKPQYCEINLDPDTLLGATPSGATGIWTSTDPTAIIDDNKFSPSSASIVGAPITFYYTYTNPATGCSSIDSITSQVDPAPTLTLSDDITLCREEGQMVRTLTGLPISATNSSDIRWILSPFFGNADRMAAGPIDNTTGTGEVTLTLQNQTADTFRIGGQAIALGSCRNRIESFDVIVNPIPDASILNDNPDGCDPVTTNFTVNITNDIDSATSEYSWNLGDGSTSTESIASATYTGIPSAAINLVLTSPAGCDTTLTSAVTIYPNPNASFLPDPNNFTTAALPRFRFTNNSSVDPVNSSVIDKNFWDFGDELVDSDTSLEVDPTYGYTTDTATYCVNLEVTTNHGCVDDTTVCVVVGPDLIVFIPNAFSPNESGPDANNGFSAIVSGHKLVELIVFNRWGEIMYQTNEVTTSLDRTIKTKAWDGTYNGELAQQDVYAYQLKVTALNDKVYEYSGTVTLLR